VAIASRNEVALLQGLGHDVQVVTAALPEGTSSDLSGFQVARFAVTGNGSLWRPVRGDVGGVGRFVRSQSWDAVILAGWQNWASDVVFDAVVGVPNAPRIVMRSHGVSTDSMSGAAPGRWARYLGWRRYRRVRIPRVLRHLAVLVPLSPRGDSDRFLDVRLARQRGIPVVPIPNIVPSFVSTTLNGRTDGDKVLAPQWLLCVGNFSPGKNELGVLEAYRRSGMHEVPILFVGPRENNYSLKLLRRATKYGLTNVRAVFNPSDAALRQLYAGALAIVLASRTECQPLAIVDGLSCAVPFVSTRVGNLDEYAGGVLVLTLEEMADVLSSIVSSPTRRAALVEAARRDHRTCLQRSLIEQRWSDLLASVDVLASGSS